MVARLRSYESMSFCAINIIPDVLLENVVGKNVGESSTRGALQNACAVAAVEIHVEWLYRFADSDSFIDGMKVSFVWKKQDK